MVGTYMETGQMVLDNGKLPLKEVLRKTTNHAL